MTNYRGGAEVLTVSDRDSLFWPKVDQTGECWIWTASTNSAGYGLFCVGESRLMLAHRYSFVRHVGPIPAGLDLCHTCDTPGCVRPAHLFIGTRADNVHDMDTKGRRVSLSGEQNPNAQLTDAAIESIRERYIPGRNRWDRGNGSELAVEFGTTRNYIAAIARGRWRSA